MTRKWEIVDDGDRDFTGPYDVWIEHENTDSLGGQIIAACFRDHAALISAAPEMFEALKLARQDISAWVESTGHDMGSNAVLDEIDSALYKATRHVPD